MNGTTFGLLVGIATLCVSSAWVPCAHPSASCPRRRPFTSPPALGVFDDFKNMGGLNGGSGSGSGMSPGEVRSAKRKAAREAAEAAKAGSDGGGDGGGGGGGSLSKAEEIKRLREQLDGEGGAAPKAAGLGSGSGAGEGSTFVPAEQWDKAAKVASGLDGGRGDAAGAKETVSRK